MLHQETESGTGINSTAPPHPACLSVSPCSTLTASVNTFPTPPTRAASRRQSMSNIRTLYERLGGYDAVYAFIEHIAEPEK